MFLVATPELPHKAAASTARTSPRRAIARHIRSVVIAFDPFLKWSRHSMGRRVRAGSAQRSEGSTRGVLEGVRPARSRRGPAVGEADQSARSVARLDLSRKNTGHGRPARCEPLEPIDSIPARLLVSYKPTERCAANSRLVIWFEVRGCQISPWLSMIRFSCSR